MRKQHITRTPPANLNSESKIKLQKAKNVIVDALMYVNNEYNVTNKQMVNVFVDIIHIVIDYRRLHDLQLELFWLLLKIISINADNSLHESKLDDVQETILGNVEYVKDMYTLTDEQVLNMLIDILYVYII